MGHDLSPEALADKMSAEQRVKQFVISDPMPVWESAIIVACVLAMWLILHYAEPLKAWIARFL